MTTDEIKNLISGLTKPANALTFDPSKNLEIVPVAFPAGDHNVCPAYITKRGDKGNKMLVCVSDEGNLYVASLKRIGACFGKTEKDLADQAEAGTLTRITCTITPPKPEDVNTYNMMKMQGKTQEELEEAGFPFKPSERRDFKKPKK